jgi:hypothetical protein
MVLTNDKVPRLTVSMYGCPYIRTLGLDFNGLDSMAYIYGQVTHDGYPANLAQIVINSIGKSPLS